MGKLSLAAVVVAVSKASASPDAYASAFEAFVTKYDKSYSSEEERAAGFDTFRKNYDYVTTENAKKQPFELELNMFADQSPEQFVAGRLGLSVPAPGKLFLGAPHLGTDLYSGAPLPSSVDWHTDGAVTEPKNQGSCGSCWTFSTTGALEGAWKIATGKLTSLSEQQFVDCSKNDGNSGCNGGSMDSAFTYLKGGHQVCTEDSYSYVGQGDGKCKDSNCTAGIPSGRLTGFKDVPVKDMEALMEAVAQQPVSVGIEADQSAFQMYKGGVLTKTCGSKLDHGVLLVGYGTDNGVDYWKIKNSWGPTWGEKGFIRIERGLSAEGECGVKMMASYPVLSKDVKARVEEAAFDAFTEKYDKKYGSEKERSTAFEAFKVSFEFVKKENAKNHTYELEINMFSDQSAHDFGAGRLGLSVPKSNGFTSLWAGLPHLGTDEYSGSALPAAVDWYTQGAVSEPKNQGSCGSCWTFSTTGALEGAWQITNGKLLSLSEQQLVDCSRNDGNSGCQGGSMDAAFTYLEKEAFCTEESYPYAGKQSTCPTQSNCTVGIPKGGVTGFKDVPVHDLNALMEAVSQQPVSVGIEADQGAFQAYKSGILTKTCGSKLDHGVLLVGYGTDQGVDYWKIKNSWGGSWGEKGFIRLERGKSSDGECGVKLMASYPVVGKSSLEIVV